MRDRKNHFQKNTINKTTYVD